MVVRRATFRLYPTLQVEQKLRYHRKLHKDIYNAAIANRRTQYERFSRSVGYLEQQNSLPEFKSVWPEYKEIAAHALQATLKRVDFAYQRLFKKLGKKPRFKSLKHYSGSSYPDNQSWKAHTTGVNGYLELAKIGSIQMRGRARVWGTPTTCTIVYRRGKWYASITIECEPTRVTGTGAIGLDFGTHHAVATSDGTIIGNPRFLAKTQDKIRKTSKAKRRKRAPNFRKKIRGSKRWKKASKRVAELQRLAANQRQDWIHKVAERDCKP